MNEAGYQTLIVKFSKPITELDGIMECLKAWLERHTPITEKTEF